MSGTVPKEYRELERAALAQGWTIQVRKNCHLAWWPPGGGNPVFSPGTPSEYRGIYNFRAKLRRAGLRV